MNNLLKNVKYKTHFLIITILLGILIINTIYYFKTYKNYEENYHYNLKIIKLLNNINNIKQSYNQEKIKLLENLKKFCNINENNEEYYILKCNNLNKEKSFILNNIIFANRFLIFKKLNMKKNIDLSNVKDGDINIKIELYKGLNFE